MPAQVRCPFLILLKGAVMLSFLPFRVVLGMTFKPHGPTYHNRRSRRGI